MWVLQAGANCSSAAAPSLTAPPLQIYQDALATSNAVAEEGFSLSRLVRAFGTEAGTAERYNASLATLRRISIRQARSGRRAKGRAGRPK